MTKSILITGGTGSFGRKFISSATTKRYPAYIVKLPRTGNQMYM